MEKEDIIKDMHEWADSALARELTDHLKFCKVCSLVVKSANWIVQEHMKELDKIK